MKEQRLFSSLPQFEPSTRLRLNVNVHLRRSNWPTLKQWRDNYQFCAISPDVMLFSDSVVQPNPQRTFGFVIFCKIKKNPNQNYSTNLWFRAKLLIHWKFRRVRLRCFWFLINGPLCVVPFVWVYQTVYISTPTTLTWMVLSVSRSMFKPSSLKSHLPRASYRTILTFMTGKIRDCFLEEMCTYTKEPVLSSLRSWLI